MKKYMWRNNLLSAEIFFYQEQLTVSTEQQEWGKDKWWTKRNENNEKHLCTVFSTHKIYFMAHINVRNGTDSFDNRQTAGVVLLNIAIDSFRYEFSNSRIWVGKLTVNDEKENNGEEDNKKKNSNNSIKLYPPTNKKKYRLQIILLY